MVLLTLNYAVAVLLGSTRCCLIGLGPGEFWYFEDGIYEQV
jgi:hypothetical protein